MLLDKTFVDTSNRTGVTALMHAANHDHSEIVSLLLPRSANANKTDRTGGFTLICAAQYGHLQTVKVRDHFSGAFCFEEVILQ